MGLRGKQAFRKLSSVEDLMDLIKMKKLVNGFLDLWRFERPISNLLTGDGRIGPCVNVTFIVKDKDGDTRVVEDRPIFLDKGEDTKLLRLRKMRKVQMRSELLSVQGLVISSIEDRTDRV